MRCCRAPRAYLVEIVTAYDSQPGVLSVSDEEYCRTHVPTRERVEEHLRILDQAAATWPLGVWENGVYPGLRTLLEYKCTRLGSSQ
jgi:hypothetical protein